MSSKYDPYKELIISREVPDSILAKLLKCSESAIRTARWKLLNPDKNETYRKKWRKENPKKVIEQRKRYLKKFSGNNWNSRTIWPDEDKLSIVDSKKTDGEFSEKFGRSITAIQRMRWEEKRIKK
jgi:hypothetical protein